MSKGFSHHWQLNLMRKVIPRRRRNTECNRGSRIHVRIRRFVLRTFMSKEEEKERWFVQSRKQALSKRPLRTVGGKKQRLRCVPVSRFGSPRT